MACYNRSLDKFEVRTFTNDNGYVVEYIKNVNDTVCDSWLLLPAGNLWPKELRATLYVVVMLYIFMGIAIVSDIFVGSIEVITSKKKKVTTFDREKQETVVREVLVWNETVANLTLLALGSSAPEIMLATIEQVSRLGDSADKIKDDLGTFTIVGSAAFNLLLITAVCVASVESPNVSAIAEYGVFGLTAFWSIFAYFWLVVVLQWSSPGVVDLWEAFLTLGFFPLLVITAFAQSHGWWLRKSGGDGRVKIVGVNLPRGAVQDTRAVALDDVEDALAMMEGHGNTGEVIHMANFSSSPRGSAANIQGAVLDSTSDNHDVYHLSPGRCSPAIRARGVQLNALPEHPNSASPSPALSEPFRGNRLEAGGGAARFLHHWRSVARRNSKDYPAVPASGRVSKASSAQNVAFADDSNVDEERRANTRLAFRRATIRALTGAKVQRSPTTVKLAGVVSAVRSAQRWATKAGRQSSIGGFGQTGAVSFSKQNYSVVKSNGLIYLDVCYRPPSGGRCASSTSVSLDNVGCSLPTGSVLADATIDSDEKETGKRVQLADVSAQAAVQASWETRDGTARAGKAYQYNSGTVVFNPGETLKHISVNIATDDVYEPDEDFYVVLSSVDGSRLTNPSIARVTIHDDDEPGTFSLSDVRYYVNKEKGLVEATVVREGGADGAVVVKFNTLDGTAHGGKNPDSADVDYVYTAGNLQFEHGQRSKTIEVPVNTSLEFTSRNFVIALTSVGKGATLGDQAAAVCIIGDDADPIVDRVARVIGAEDEEEITWGSQFRSAMEVGGDVNDDGEEEPPTNKDYFLHFLTMPWKVLFAVIPPRNLRGGWPCFIVSLCFVGLLTALVEQLANLLGCAVNLKTSVTGITLIALGTSLPDTFASRAAALQDKHADAAIGNVTGSNSVNVFLGLGLPWCISSVYHKIKDTKFLVSRFNLTFSVTVFIGVAIGGIILLIVRRKVFGGELGGPKRSKYFSALLLVLLWLVYILLASLKAYGHIESSI